MIHFGKILDFTYMLVPTRLYTSFVFCVRLVGQTTIICVIFDFSRQQLPQTFEVEAIFFRQIPAIFSDAQQIDRE